MLYVLDLDDTLYLERDYVRSGFKAVDAWLSENTLVKNFFEAAWTLFEEGVRGNIFNRVLDALSCCSEGLVETLVGVYQNHLPDISLMPDAAEFLKSFTNNQLAMITDGYSEVQWKKVKALALEKYIGKIIVTGDWGKSFWKPHQRAYFEVSNGLNTEECLYIGDNPIKDFQAPRELKWSPSIRIRRDGSLKKEKETPSDCIEIISLLELLETSNT
jgi:putative hydrolase of the HAD superfamily